MIKEEFRDILRKYSQGKASISEIKLVESYYDLLDNKSNGIDSLDEVQTNLLYDSIYLDLNEHSTVFEKQPDNTKRKNYYIRRYGAVAAIIISLLVAGIFYTNSTNKNIKQKIGKTTPILNEENRVKILPDGSIVYLKGDSKIFFPPSFENVSTRKIILEGEAFFDVVHNPSQPFIVKAGNIETVVLGTSFNIQMNNKANEIVTITVKTGRVKILDHKQNSIGILTKNQQIVYSNSKFNIRGQIPVENYLSWKKQDLILEEVTLSEACRILEDRFDTQIILNPETPNKNRFTATFSQNETIEKAVKVISAFNGIKFQYDSIKNVTLIGYE